MDKSLKNPYMYTALNMIGSFLPLIISYVILRFTNTEDGKWPKLYELGKEGQVAIICIPIVISIVLSLYHYKKEIGIRKWPEYLFIINFLLLIIIIPLYSVSVTGSFDQKFFFDISLIFLATTTVSLFLTTLVENENMLSVKESRKGDQDRLQTKFDQSRTAN